jgi:hypothetical protein
MRYTTPDFIKEWYSRRPPKCCHTCDKFISFEGRCIKFDQIVPEQFAKEIDQCDEWQELVIPF